MKKRDIITVPNPILKEKTEKVLSFDSALKNQVKEMIKTLRREGGVGLAANQIGYKNQVIAIELQRDAKNPDVEEIPLTISINPEIVEYSKEKECFEEGCLSVPKIEFDLERPSSLKIKYKDIKGRKIKIAPKGLLARILQHEIDHLNGILFVELAKKQFLQKNPQFKNLKILFLGSGEFGSIILEGLIHLGLNLNILTEKGKPAGRYQMIRQTPVVERAKRFGKNYLEIENIKQADIPDFDLLICADFGQKIPENILNKRRNTINIHPSLLPKHRGPSPIQTAILRGDKKTGVSIIKMTNKIDEGPIYGQAEIDILPNDDNPTLRDRLATLGLKLLIKTLPPLINNKLKLIPQDSKKASTTKIFKKEDGQINWKKKPQTIDRQIRAFRIWPKSYTFIDNKRLIIHQAHLENDQLVLDCVQLEGKSPVSFEEFLRGFRGPKPEWFKKILIK